MPQRTSVPGSSFVPPRRGFEARVGSVTHPETTGGPAHEGPTRRQAWRAGGEGEAPSTLGGGEEWCRAGNLARSRGSTRQPARQQLHRSEKALYSATAVASSIALLSVSHMHRMRTPFETVVNIVNERPFGSPATWARRRAPHVARYQPGWRGPSALRPRVTAGLPVRGCSPFGSSASSAPGLLSQLPVVEARGFAPPPRGGFALSWLEGIVDRSRWNLSRNFGSGKTSRK